MKLSVLFRDGELFVVDKPPGIATTSPDGRHCLTEVAQRANRWARVHPTSRLDRDVTGVVVFALTDRAIQATLEARREGHYARRYAALASGWIAEDEGRWEWPIAIDPSDRKHRVALGEGEKGEREQAARTRFEVLDRSALATRLWLHPETGRTHQLRVHASRAGHALLGDVAYEGPKRVVLADGRVVTVKRPMLHCARVELPHPATGERLTIEAPIPADLEAAWASLRDA
ncbi:MAG: RluA family pseudouridine synthase [Sandaracinus sp.]